MKQATQDAFEQPRRVGFSPPILGRGGRLKPALRSPTAFAVLLCFFIYNKTAFSKIGDFNERLSAAREFITAERGEIRTFPAFRDMTMDARSDLIRAVSEAKHVSAIQGSIILDEYMRTAGVEAAAKFNEAHAQSIANHFTLAEINEMIRFYHSDVGLKIEAFTPMMSQEMRDYSRSITETYTARFYRMVLGLPSKSVLEQYMEHPK